MKLNIRPLDTLFFRDGKPFSRGEETWAEGVFPPYPSVIYGALRTWYISNHLLPFSDEAIDKSAGIQVSGLRYRTSESMFMPMPLDLVEPKEKSTEEKNSESRNKKYRVIRLHLHQNTGVISSHPDLPDLDSAHFLLLPSDNEQVESIDDGLMEVSDIERYLNDPFTEGEVRRIKDLAASEPKTGIGREDATNVASDALLYRVGMRRATDFGISVECDLPDENLQQQSFVVRLGGENKMVALESHGGRVKISPDAVQLKPGGFKLYLSTPAIFNNGWKPDLNQYGIQANLFAAVTGKPLHIGGFDMVNNKPKPMYKAVPAGSVYYYKTEEPTDKIMTLFGRAISDIQKEQGFGIAYVGNY